LLPLVYRRLNSRNLEPRDLNILKGVYRQAWYKNNLLFQTMEKVAISFNEAGIEPFMLNGVAITIFCHRDDGIRPLDGLDLFVPIVEKEGAIKLLSSMGFKAIFVQDSLILQHTIHFVGSHGELIRLHSHIVPGHVGPSRDRSEQDLQRNAIYIDFRGIKVRILSQADQLLITLLHGIRSQNFYWMADAYSLISQPDFVFDWNRLIGNAQIWHLTLQTRHTIRFLAQELGAAVPFHVLDALEDANVLIQERLEYIFLSNYPTILGSLPDAYLNYSLELAEHVGFLDRCYGFLFYLQRHWDCQSLAQVPFTAARKALNNVLDKNRRR
jgi:hypothetical protein